MSALRISDINNKRFPEIPVGPDFTRPHHHASVGIEVELEGVNSPPQPLKMWQSVHDGSLQGGVEFVSDPVWGSAISAALEELHQYLVTTDVQLSFRTSVHIHLNILDLTADQLASFIRMYLLYESAFYRLHERWDRGSCLFCVPVFTSVKLQQAFGKALKGINNRSTRGFDSTYKYSGLNIKTVNNLGTVEFRQMGGTNNMTHISDWINIILQLKVAAILDEPIDQPEEVWGEYLHYLDIQPVDIERGIATLEYVDLWRLS